ncbi:MAG: DEAD/DEAH box helicase family protein [Methanofastidiosum sp.]|jgi:type III restriction enzyme
MQLKNYQKKTLDSLEQFLRILDITDNISDAYEKYWNDNNVNVGFGGVPSYKDIIKGVPHVCFKIPTGGGKTYIASSSLKTIFDNMPLIKKKVVVWLVPSDIILEQTIRVLKDPHHPYRQKINRDFNSRVEVYTKEELLSGQNFNSTIVNEQLSILVLTFDTFRSTKKEDRKIYQENANLEQFIKFFDMRDTLIDNIDETALIQVINQMMPVVIVDESHNATSDLSIEMLENINPSFILDLTATPRENSNIIVYVDASQLKKENMVKLPVIAYNRPSQQEVITDAIDLRNKLEKQAIEEEKQANNKMAGSGTYIRPIVLFQAEPRTKKDNTTFEKLKDKLIKIGIPENQIAIKTAQINEIANIDLMSRDCEIRYIITVNALKEGWDCPFAYILATLANRSSVVDVEQILGRVLRQPYATLNSNNFLNMSYVLTSSNDFKNTLENIIKGLNRAGFSKNDVRIPSESGFIDEVEDKETNIVLTIEDFDPKKESESLNFDPETISQNLKERMTEKDDNPDSIVDIMLERANKQIEKYEEELQEITFKGTGLSVELKEKMNIFNVNTNFESDLETLRIPQFYIKTESNIFNENEALLTRELLTKNFILSDKPLPTNLTQITEDVYSIDVKGDKTGSSPKYRKLSKQDITFLKEYIESRPTEERINVTKNLITHNLGYINYVSANDLQKYVDRIVNNLDSDELVFLQNNIFAVANRIKSFINLMVDEHRKSVFLEMLEKGLIYIKHDYKLPYEINPLKANSFMNKSLYTAEANDMNTTEHKIINQIISLDNVSWWHRIIERDNKEFKINGFINHYPDFMIMTNRGTLLLIEVKGEHIASDETFEKAMLGRKWKELAGSDFRYYMVFLNKSYDKEGVYSLNDLLDIIQNL